VLCNSSNPEKLLSIIRICAVIGQWEPGGKGIITFSNL
jgi:hypothetical protein